jgi:hypothetical protein
MGAPEADMPQDSKPYFSLSIPHLAADCFRDAVTVVGTAALGGFAE